MQSNGQVFGSSPAAALHTPSGTPPSQLPSPPLPPPAKQLMHVVSSRPGGHRLGSKKHGRHSSGSAGHVVLPPPLPLPPPPPPLQSPGQLAALSPASQTRLPQVGLVLPPPLPQSC